MKKKPRDLQIGDVIQRVNFATSATTLNKKYVICSKSKVKGFEDYIRVMYKNDNGKRSPVNSLKNWIII